MQQQFDRLRLCRDGWRAGFRLVQKARGLLHHAHHRFEQLQLFAKLFAACRQAQDRIKGAAHIRADAILLRSEVSGLFRMLLRLQRGLRILQLTRFIAQLHLIAQSLHHFEHDLRRQAVGAAGAARFAFARGDHLFRPTVERVRPKLRASHAAAAEIHRRLITERVQRLHDLRFLHLADDVLEMHLRLAGVVGFEVALNNAHDLALTFFMLGDACGFLHRLFFQTEGTQCLRVQILRGHHLIA